MIFEHGLSVSTILKVLFFISMAIYAVGFYNEELWLGELIVSFALQHIIASLVFLSCFAILRQKRFALTAASFLFMQIWQVFTYHPSTVLPNGENIRILQYNVFYENKRLDQVINWIDTNHDSFDIVFLQEVTPEFEKKLSKLRTKFPYMISSKDDKCLVKTLLSKIPISKYEIRNYKGIVKQYMVVDFRLKDNKAFTLFGIHPTSPKSENCWRERNIQLASIAKDVSEHKSENKLIMGDFNTTPYSVYFRNFVNLTNTKPTMRGFAGNTWPSACKLNILMVPIDHMLVSKSIQVIKRKVGPDLGSDHLPVLTHIAIP